MRRNLHRRVEACFPIESNKLRRRVIEDLELYLQDNANAWELQQDGTYRQVDPAGEPLVSAQQKLLEKYAG